MRLLLCSTDRSVRHPPTHQTVQPATHLCKVAAQGSKGGRLCVALHRRGLEELHWSGQHGVHAM